MVWEAGDGLKVNCCCSELESRRKSDLDLASREIMRDIRSDAVQLFRISTALCVQGREGSKETSEGGKRVEREK